MPWMVKKHLQEQHSGFAYKCPDSQCRKILPRPMSHPSCTTRPKDMVLYHRETGTRGLEAQELLKKWQTNRLPHMWEETFKSPLAVPPRAISPLPKTPEKSRSPLERCYRGKRPSDSSHSAPSKKSRKSEERRVKEPDFRNDPLTISLEQRPMSSQNLCPWWVSPSLRRSSCPRVVAP